MMKKAKYDLASRTTGADEVPDSATPVREKPTQTPELVGKLQQALKETSDHLKRSNAQVKELQQFTTKSTRSNRMSNASSILPGSTREELEEVAQQLRAVRQEGVNAKKETASKDEQLRLMREEVDRAKAEVASLLPSRSQQPQVVPEEVEAVDPQLASLKSELEAARQETHLAKEQLDAANKNIKIARSGLAQVKELVGQVQGEKEEAKANAASLTMQLEASREEEEKGRTDAASMEKDFHEMRLRHGKEVTALKEQVKEWEGIAAEAKQVNELNDENEELEEQLQNEITRHETLETEVKKLKSEIEETKAKGKAAPAAKSLAPSEPHTSPIMSVLKNPPALLPVDLSNSNPYLVSVAGLTVPSTPLPTALPGHPTTPTTTSTPKSEYTPEHKALTTAWNARMITLPEYIEGMKALKRKPDDVGETPEPIKKLRLSGESAELPVGDLLTPGGGPALKLPRQDEGGGEDDGVASDGEDFWSSFGGDADNSGTFTYGLSGADGTASSASAHQDAAKGEINPVGDTLVDDSNHSNADLYEMPSPSPNKQPPQATSNIPTPEISTIELNSARKRKISIDDEAEGSPRPSQVLRTREDLGDEQTLALDDMTPKTVADKPAIILTPATKRIFSEDDGDMPPRSSQMPRTKVDLGDEQTPTLEEIMAEDSFDTSRKGNEATEASGTAASPAENEDPAPEAASASTEPADPNNDSIMANTNETNVTSIVGATHPTPVQAARSTSRLPKLMTASPRKSTRNAGKPVGSLNENMLSKMSASPMKEEKETDAKTANGRGKSPVKSTTKSPAKKTFKSPAKSRTSRSPSKSKGGR